jgi:hypothetical protein
MIKYLAESKLIESPIDVNKFVSLLDTLKRDREKVVTSLAKNDYLPKGLNSKQVANLLNQKFVNNRARRKAIRTLTEKNLIASNLDVDGALDIVGPIQDSNRGHAPGYWSMEFPRYYAIKALLDAKNPVIKTPISAEDLTKLVKGVREQGAMIKYLAESKLIESPISIDKTVNLLNTVTWRHRVLIELVNNGHLPKMTTAKQVTDLLYTQNKQEWYYHEYRDAIRALVAKGLMPNNLSVDEAVSILGSLTDKGSKRDGDSNWREHAIRTLTNAKNPIIKTPIDAEDLTKLLKGVKRQGELTKYLSKNQLIQ